MIKSASDRRKFRSERRLCFNYIGTSTGPLTAAATEGASYANFNTTPEFAKKVLMKPPSQC